MVLGEILAVVGLLLAFADRCVGFYWFATGRENAAPVQLKTDGLYRYVRHPLYATGLVIHLAVPAYDHWHILVINLSLTIYILDRRVFRGAQITAGIWPGSTSIMRP